MQNETVVKIRKLHKKFWYFKKDMKAIRWLFNKNSYDAEFHVLKGLNIDIEKGEAVGVLGKNGAGKSTLLKIVSGIYHPTYGTVETEGVVSSLLELGAGFSNQLTGRENIYLKGTLLGYTDKQMDGMIDDIIQFADIGDYMELPFESYSSGMKARLGFALAVTVDPDILIIDEVFAVGDRNFQEKSRAKTIEFFEQGKTILFVSHSEGLIREFCNRVIYLKDGHVAYDGEVEGGIEMYQKDIEINSRIPRFFIQDVQEDSEFIDLKILYGLGRDLKISSELHLVDLNIEVEEFNDNISEYFIHTEIQASYDVIDKNILNIKIPKKDIDRKINIRIKILGDDKHTAHNYLMVNTPEISRGLKDLTNSFDVSSSDKNVVTITPKGGDVE